MIKDIAKTENERTRLLVVEATELEKNLLLPHGKNSREISLTGHEEYFERVGKRYFGDSKKPLVVIRDWDIAEKYGESPSPNQVVFNLLKSRKADRIFSRIVEDTEQKNPGLRCARTDLTKAMVTHDFRNIPSDSSKYGPGTFYENMAHNAYFQGGRLLVPTGCVYTSHGGGIVTNLDFPSIESDGIHGQFLLENLIHFLLEEASLNVATSMCRRRGTVLDVRFKEFIRRHDSFLSAKTPEDFLGGPLSDSLSLKGAVEYFGGFEQAQDALRHYNETFYPDQIKLAASGYAKAEAFLNTLRE